MSKKTFLCLGTSPTKKNSFKGPKVSFVSAAAQDQHDVSHRSETSRTRQEGLVLNGKRKSSAEPDGLDYFGYSEDSLAAKRCKNLKGSPDSPPLQGNTFA